eukprot:Tamp_15488.p1 GENE.Tamp_15488~~Tamp_15488.p1  ORF type:complete len:139 (-),score=31.76 Tamp_15488:701-1117(-)
MAETRSESSPLHSPLPRAEGHPAALRQRKRDMAQMAAQKSLSTAKSAVDNILQIQSKHKMKMADIDLEETEDYSRRIGRQVGSMLDAYVTLLMMVTFTVYCIWELSVILDEFVASQNSKDVLVSLVDKRGLEPADFGL